MSFRHQDTETPSATHLLAENHSGTDLNEYREQEGVCYFCGHDGAGMPAEEVISEDYFSDHDLANQPQSDHVCASCAYCMDQRELKQGHWIVSSSEHRRVSTGDLLEEFEQLERGEYKPPLAVHVSEDPIRSEHAYLWTPVIHSTDTLLLTYSRETAFFEWDEFHEILSAVEELRWHGFRGDDIRSGEPRVRDLDSVGAERYWTLNERIEPHRGTAFLDIAWTVSRSRDDQPNPPQSDS
jgi:hypothetical protein